MKVVEDGVQNSDVWRSYSEKIILEGAASQRDQFMYSQNHPETFRTPHAPPE